MTKLQLEVGQVYDSKLTGFISLFLIYLMSIHLTSCFTQFSYISVVLAPYLGLLASGASWRKSVWVSRVSSLVQDEHEGSRQGQCPTDASRKPTGPTCVESFFPVTS